MRDRIAEGPVAERSAGALDNAPQPVRSAETRAVRASRGSAPSIRANRERAKLLARQCGLVGESRRIGPRRIRKGVRGFVFLAPWCADDPSRIARYHLESLAALRHAAGMGISGPMICDVCKQPANVRLGTSVLGAALGGPWICERPACKDALVRLAEKHGCSARGAGIGVEKGEPFAPDVLVCLYCDAPYGETHSPMCAIRAGAPRLFRPKESALRDLVEALYQLRVTLSTHEQRDKMRAVDHIVSTFRGDIPPDARRK